MPDILVSNIKETKTIREFLGAKADKIESIKSGENPLYNVDVIWDGANYYLAFTTENDTDLVVIQSLDSMLPLAIKLKP